MSSSPFTLPAQLQGPPLTDREAVADALYRAVLAFDHDDAALLSSAFTDDVVFEIPHSTTTGLAVFKGAVFDRVAKLDTTHLLTNMRVSIESATTARATCTALAQHARAGMGCEPGPNRYMVGAQYLCEVVKVGEG